MSIDERSFESQAVHILTCEEGWIHYLLPNGRMAES
jgi:hypothetical protein